MLTTLLIALGSVTASAHGVDHRETSAGAPLVDRAGESIPVHLVAAVCGMPGRRGDAGFERRLQLAEYLLAQAAQAPRPTSPPPLLQGLGDHGRKVSTAAPTAQRYFDQGLLLAFAFNHPEALVSFREARRIDPDCAMCWWGEAYVLGPNINAPMDPEAVAPARHAIERAMTAAANGTTEVERALIDAMSRRYSPDPGADRAALDRHFADAMAQVAARFDADADVLSIYADALMNTRPWDYWQADGRTMVPELAPLVPTLERALAVDPDNPMAIHLYIHAVEASNRPELAAPHADRLVTAAPGAGHLVHMPSHLYIRLGRYRESIAVNRLAMVADEAYLAQKREDTPYRYTYYPHNVHFVLESARLSGDRASALEAADRLAGLTTLELSVALPWVQLMDAAPYFAHAQFSAPSLTLALPRPSPRLPYVVGAWHYARAAALLQSGRADAALDEVAAMRALAGETDWDTRMPGTPADQLLAIGALVIEARHHRRNGDLEDAIAAYREAVGRQDGLPYLEPPMWYYPVRQSLGASLLEAGDAVGAVEVFEQALARDPNQALLLFGLSVARDAAGRAEAARQAHRQFRQVWLGGDAQPTLADL